MCMWFVLYVVCTVNIDLYCADQTATMFRIGCACHCTTVTVYKVMKSKVMCYQLQLGKYLADILTECSSCHQGIQGESEEV